MAVQHHLLAELRVPARWGAPSDFGMAMLR
jgi:hypothetical protein